MQTKADIAKNAQERFEYWWKKWGCWLYTRERALEVWKTRGIDGLPRYPGFWEAA